MDNPLLFEIIGRLYLESQVEIYKLVREKEQLTKERDDALKLLVQPKDPHATIS